MEESEDLSKENTYIGNYSGLSNYLKRLVQFQDKENLDFIYVTFTAQNNMFDNFLSDLKARKSTLLFDHGFVPKDDVFDDVIKQIERAVIIDFWDTLSNVMYLFPDKYSQYIRNRKILQRWYIGNSDPIVPFDDNYISKQTGKYLSEFFYSKEDMFDQVICLLGKRLGYDIIFLEKMAGKTRIVSEILDTRIRQDSVKNLYWQIS